jgi:hypothetical protein
MANDFASPPDDYELGAFDISHDHDHHEQQTNDDVMSEPEAMARPSPRVIRADFSRLWMSLFAWFYHFRVSRAAFAALLAILAHFTLFLVATANLFSSDGGTYPGDDDVVFPSLHRLDNIMTTISSGSLLHAPSVCPCMSQPTCPGNVRMYGFLITDNLHFVRRVAPCWPIFLKLTLNVQHHAPRANRPLSSFSHTSLLKNAC